MAQTPALLLPAGTVDPLRALVRRIVVALGLWLLVAAITYLGRSGYRDVDGSSITVLDAVYYASVSVTTTGYGDITPVSDGARALTAFVVTPARILFLIVLVGTTVELLTERYRGLRAESRWRTKVDRHIVVVGYGTTGRGAIDTLLAGGVTREGVLVIDQDAGTAADARAAGFAVVHGDATRTIVLQHAQIAQARAVVVACPRDDTSTLVTLTARELNPTAPISAAVRETENAHLLRQSGANAVVVSSEATGRLLGLSTEQPRAVAVLEELIVAGRGLALAERALAPDEVGGTPRPIGSDVPIAVVRAGECISFDDARFAAAQPGDVVVAVVPESPSP